jgi:NAD(P)-dependent dehydrogenase (short-subunit alcohol dehydrogenase family)
VVKYDAAVEQDAFDIVKELQQKHGVDRLDIVVANAAIVKSYPLVKDVKRAEILELFEVNAFGVVSLYQATRYLLQESPNKPIFAPVGSSAGALG